jgi:hypothetical protein
LVRTFKKSFSVLFPPQIDDLDGVWQLETHGFLEGSAMSEILALIKEMECDFSQYVCIHNLSAPPKGSAPTLLRLIDHIP